MSLKPSWCPASSISIANAADPLASAYLEYWERRVTMTNKFQGKPMHYKIIESQYVYWCSEAGDKKPPSPRLVLKENESTHLHVLSSYLPQGL